MFCNLNHNEIKFFVDDLGGAEKEIELLGQYLGNLFNPGCEWSDGIQIYIDGMYGYIYRISYS